MVNNLLLSGELQRFRMLQILQEEEDRPEDEYEEMKNQTDFFFSTSNTAYRNSTMSENSIL
jgi:hypothetical protein